MDYNLEEVTKAMGKKLVLLRGDKTQDEVAKALNISKSALSMYENGQRIPRDTIKARIADYYHRSIAFIFFSPNDHNT